MANRTDQRHNELDKLTRQDAAAALKFLSSPTSNLQARYNFDDLILSLASARENRRARQVNEWERIGRQTLGSYV